jgi:hypothetical protein
LTPKSPLRHSTSSSGVRHLLCKFDANPEEKGEKRARLRGAVLWESGLFGGVLPEARFWLAAFGFLNFPIQLIESNFLSDVHFFF